MPVEQLSEVITSQEVELLPGLRACSIDSDKN